MIKDIRDIEIGGKTLVMRVDLNLPRNKKGKLEESARLLRLLPHLRSLLKKKARLLLLSHLGRPQGRDETYSLKPVFHMLKKHLADYSLDFIEDSMSDDIGRAFEKGAHLVLAENLRFYEGEQNNDDAFAKKLAAWGDIYVNDAFSCCHRSHASCVAITHHLPSYGGALLLEEYETLHHMLFSSERPNCAVIGGAKIGSKIAMIETLLRRFDMVVIGGAMANTFLVGRGFSMGESFFEVDCVETALHLEEMARRHETSLLLPVDGLIGRSLDDTAPMVRGVDDIPSWGVMGDMGPCSMEAIGRALSVCRSLIWNGPLGAFEYEPFAVSTHYVGKVIADLTENHGLLSVIGGGDTHAALSQFHLTDKMSYASLSGGAFLAWVAGETLPALRALGIEN